MANFRTRAGYGPFLFAVLAGLSWASCLTTAWGQQSAPQQNAPQTSNADLQKRVQALEEQLRQLQAAKAPGAITTVSTTVQPTPLESGTAPEMESTSTGIPGSAPSFLSEDGKKDKPLAGWDEMFYLRSADDRYKLRITGQIQADYRAFLAGSDSTDIDTFLMRRARLGIEADMFQYYEFRLLPDFGQATPVIQDAYLNVHYWDEFQVEAGRFKQPVSYEQLIQDRFIPTIERSLIDQLVPARDEGVMIHGQKLLNGRLDYYASVSNGEINGNADSNDRKDVNGRLVVRPFYDPDTDSPLKYLQVGISGSTGLEQEPVNPSTLRTPATVPFFTFNSTVRADGLRHRWTPEVSYFWGSFGLAAQYFHMDQKLRPGSTGAALKIFEDIPFDGYYVLATYLLTGEERTTYSEPITPLHPFNPCHPFSCGGAWEAVVRFSDLHIGDTVFRPGVANLADPTRYANTATELTTGFNWYLNKWVRLQFNYERAWFNTPVLLGPPPGGLLRHSDALLTRFQVIF